MARSPPRRDDRHVRDRRDDRSYRRRSRSRDRDGRRPARSRSPAHRRHDERDRDGDRDRDYDRRPARSPDGYRDSRAPRRERSRERKRSRDGSPVRDRRLDRERYRAPNDRRDEYYDDRYGDRYDERDRKRPRRDDDPPRRRRDDSRDRLSSRPSSSRNEDSRLRTAEQTAEEAKLAKLAKVEAWKKKMEEKKRAEAGPSEAASPQTKTGDVTPAVPSIAPDSPAPESPAPESSAAESGDGSGKQAPYAGKFDPKAIAKRAAAALEKHRAALGGDVVIPKSAPSVSNVNGSAAADKNKVESSRFAKVASSTSKLGNGKISGFGLNKSTTTKPDRSTALKAVAALDEEEAVERKLEKLPDMPTAVDSEDAALANGQDDQDEEGDLDSDEEEAAEAARQAAQKRAEEAQAETQDTVMINGENTAKEFDAAGTTAQSAKAPDIDRMEEDEIDPLDAFMNNLEHANINGPANLAKRKGKNHQTQVFNNDDDNDMDAVGNDADDLLAITAKRKKKDIPTVDHSKMQYEPFRKSFYSESTEIAEMDEEQVAILRADLDNITCRGSDVPKPIVKWAQGGFGAQILDVIRDLKYEKPTSIQCQALPAIMSGRDVIGVAKTGSGKTMAFILPMLRHIKDQRPVEGLDGPIGLILAPTRELATQIHRDLKPFLKVLNLRAVCAYGGAPIKDQIAELKRGTEIIVCTAGRFIDLLAANSGRVTNLRRVTYVVLDEADRMFDMGFEPQITKILGNIRPQRQTVLFSATFPRNMESLARKALTKPIEITVGGRSVVAPEITQIIEVREDDSKFVRLLELLGNLHDQDEDARSLVFVERQELADKMYVDLTRKGYPCVTIHGGRDQSDRDAAISDFKAGITPVMIATSVAARGLDVKQLKLVVNYDCPNHIEDYVHRSGRTGRAGNTGTAVTFVTPQQDRFAPFLIKALNDSKVEVPADLKALEETYKEKVKAGNATKTSSGFGGRGIERLAAARDAQRALEKGRYKTGDDSDDEAQPNEDEKKNKETKEKEFDKMLAKATGGVKDRDAASEPVAAPAPASALPEALADHLNNAMKVQKVERPVPSTSGPAGSEDPLAKVAAAAAGINSRLGAKGSTRPGVPIDNRGPDAGAFHATLEINDFPQKARWGVTNRTNVAKILDATGTSITTKGNYYPAGKEPELGGQPKLYILVEGDTEVQVRNAMTDLTRLLKEGTIAALDSDARAPASGRYSVV